MPALSRSVAPSRKASAPLQTWQAPVVLADVFGVVEGERALVFGPSAIEAVCDLIYAGCAAVTTLPLGQRLERRRAELIVVPQIACPEEADQALKQGERALTEAGRIVMQTVADSDGRLGRTIAAGLRGHGFSAVRVRQTAGRSLVTGERPLFGPVGRA